MARTLLTGNILRTGSISTIALGGGVVTSSVQIITSLPTGSLSSSAQVDIWDRANAYPKVTDQLDMLWHMMDDEVIPGKGSDWYNAILSVKTEYPKP